MKLLIVLLLLVSQTLQSAQITHVVNPPFFAYDCNEELVALSHKQRNFFSEYGPERYQHGGVFVLFECDGTIQLVDDNLQELDRELEFVQALLYPVQEAVDRLGPIKYSLWADTIVLCIISDLLLGPERLKWGREMYLAALAQKECAKLERKLTKETQPAQPWVEPKHSVSAHVRRFTKNLHRAK